MNKASPGAGAAGPGHRTMEIGVAAGTAVFALIIIGGSVKAGINWDSSGPRAGFFPFYIALFVLVASIVNLVQAITAQKKDKLFATWEQLRRVASVVVPTTVYVWLVPWIGIYVSSMLLIGVFMKWLGRYRWAPVLAIAIGVPIVTFVVFERWFLVPLPKGPIEEWLGF